MSKAENGSKVKVLYTTKLQDGTVVDSSKNNEPIEITLGENSILPNLEREIIGMEPGETKEVSLPAEKAFGQHKKELVFKLDKEKIPKESEPEIGQSAMLNVDDANNIPVVITDITSDKIVVDGNHPLSGKDLVFEIKILDVA